MHELTGWQHGHAFIDPAQRSAERRTYWVIALTAVTMVVELVAGGLTGSMALLADGWHMATHVGALGITALAFYLARRHADNPRFTFGTGKVAVLGGYTSAVVLAVVAVIMAVESARRLIEPETVHFREAMMVAWVGLAVNLLSVWLLRGGRGGHDHHHHPRARHHDHNLRAAYLHVLADALTSILAIIALWSGARLGWVWMDPLMGIVGALVISRWAYGLLRDSGGVLLDAEDYREIERAILAAVEAGSDERVADLHVWRVGPHSLACIVSLVTHRPVPAAAYKERLLHITGLDHVTVEVNHCTPEQCPWAREPA